MHTVSVVAQLEERRPPNTAAARRGPMAAMQATNEKVVSERDRLEFLEESRLDAILGSCSRSHKSVRSGIRCWMAFVGEASTPCVSPCLLVACLCADKYDPVLKRYFPPPIDLLLSWTTMFRSAQTLGNYLGYVQTGCLIASAPTQVGKMTLVMC